VTDHHPTHKHTLEVWSGEKKSPTKNNKRRQKQKNPKTFKENKTVKKRRKQLVLVCIVNRSISYVNHIFSLLFMVFVAVVVVVVSKGKKCQNSLCDASEVLKKYYYLIPHFISRRCLCILLIRLFVCLRA